MKKKKSFFKRTLIVIFLSFVFFVFSNSFNASHLTSANSNGNSVNAHLISENQMLREKYDEIKLRLAEMEVRIQEINEYNNTIYSQILGVDFDTTGFYKYRNDSARLVFSEYKPIFDVVDERSLYAAEMLALQLEKVQKTSNLFKKNKNAIYYYPNISPIKTKDFIYLSSPYGWREHPVSGEYLFHEGVDISAYVGTPVYSTAQGRVEKIMYSKYGYGNRVLIKHAYGFETLYAHLGTIKVKRGQWIRKNQLIGTVGNSGTSTGPHLHYEIRKNNEPRDPLGYFYTHVTGELLAMNK